MNYEKHGIHHGRYERCRHPITPPAILRRPEREKSASAIAAVAIIGYPRRYVPQVSLSGAVLPPRDTHPPLLTARTTTRRRSSPRRFVAVPNPNRTAKF